MEEVFFEAEETSVEEEMDEVVFEAEEMEEAEETAGEEEIEEAEWRLEILEPSKALFASSLTPLVFLEVVMEVVSLSRKGG